MKHFLMMAALLAGTVCMAENLLVNGDMKNSKAWLIANAPQDAAIRAKILTYVDEGPNGGRVLKFEDCCEDFNPHLIQWAKVSGVTPEQQYKLTFSLKAEKGKSVWFMIQMAGKSKYIGACDVRKFVGTGDWKKHEVVFSKAKPETTMFGIEFLPSNPYKGGKEQTGSFLLTDVSLERLP